MPVVKKEKAMIEKGRKNEHTENIQQNTDQGYDKNRKPITPEPPQRKDPMAEPEAVIKKEKADLYTLPTFSKNGYLQAVIEIPAGSNVKYEYMPQSGAFIANEEEGRTRIIEFLPYPANYGFIPSTLMSKKEGGDGDPLDVMVLSEYIAQGELVEMVPLAILRYNDQGERDDKILAIPLEESRQIVRAGRMQDVPQAVLQILELWFLNYKKDKNLQSFGWGDEMEAEKAISKWRIR